MPVHSVDGLVQPVDEALHQHGQVVDLRLQASCLALIQPCFQAPDGDRRLHPHSQTGHVPADLLKHKCRHAFVLPEETQEQVLGTDVEVAQLGGLATGSNGKEVRMARSWGRYGSRPVTAKPREDACGQAHQAPPVTVTTAVARTADQAR